MRLEIYTYAYFLLAKFSLILLNRENAKIPLLPPHKKYTWYVLGKCFYHCVAGLSEQHTADFTFCYA